MKYGWIINIQPYFIYTAHIIKEQMRKLKLPKGYIITISTWENDGDNRRDDILHTTSTYSAEAISGICKEYMNNPDIGNLYEPDEDEIEQYEAFIKEMAAKYPDELSFSNFSDLRENNIPVSEDLLYDIGLSKSSDFFTRRLEGYTVEYVSEDVYVEVVEM
jgi:hypothetical protein